VEMIKPDKQGRFYRNLHLLNVIEASKLPVCARIQPLYENMFEIKYLHDKLL